MALMLCCVAGFAESARARHHVELESTYLGDGWFQYRLRAVDDPFFLFFDLGSLSVPFPGHAEFGPDAAEWSSQFIPGPTNGPRALWVFTNCHYVACQTRPYERTFLARSDYRHFKLATNSLFTISFAMLGGYHGNLSTVNIVGLLRIHALVPCPAEEADQSPTNLVERFTVINLPDVQIDNLVRSGSEVRGIRFSYPEASTVQLQATRDFQSWTNVDFIYGNPGATTWMSDMPLNNYGDFFRLLLAAEGHAPLPSNASASKNVNRAPCTLAPRWSGNFPLLRSIKTSANELTLSWPTAYTNYNLQTASSASSTNWIHVANSPVIISNMCVLTNTVTSTNQFFRLVKP